MAVFINSTDLQVCIRYILDNLDIDFIESNQDMIYDYLLDKLELDQNAIAILLNNIIAQYISVRLVINNNIGNLSDSLRRLSIIDYIIDLFTNIIIYKISSMTTPLQNTQEIFRILEKHQKTLEHNDSYKITGICEKILESHCLDDLDEFSNKYIDITIRLNHS